MHLDGGIWYGRAGDESGADVFSLAFDTTTGEYTFTLLGNLDHPVAGTEDNIVLDFTFTATDFDGDTATGSFSIDVDDDMPVATSATNLLVNGDFVGGTFEGHGDFPNSFPWGDNGHGGTDTNGIEGWTVTGGQAERVGNNYLGMTTSNGNPMLDMAASPGNIQIAQTINGLTSGQTYAIQFEAGAPVPSSALLEVYWDNVLIATIDTAGPMTSYVLSVVAAGASGSLSFREVGLDNATSVSPTPGTHGHHGTYLANIGLVQVATVDEDGLTLANSHGNAEGIGDDTQIGDAPTNSSAVTQSLGIRWGADDNDSGADPDGVQDTPDGTGDRSLTFTNALVTIGGAATLTSNGDPVSYEVVDNGTRLVGYVNSGDDGYTDGDRLVFEVTLSDDGSGSFTFTLRDNLDHAQGNNENDISLAFNYTATDSDGDTATGSFAVVVDDDMPVAGENVVAFTDDETAETPDAEPNLGGTDDYGGNPPANLTGTLAHAYGADGAGSTLLLDTPTSGFTYALNGNGTILTISQVQGDSPVDVLRVTLTDTVSGDYTIEHLNEIDHSAPGASEENLVLSVNYRVTDDDGDTVDGSLSINVDDDTPTVVADSICEATPAEPGGVANFVLVLDTSGSIEWDQLSLIQDSVENLLNQIGSSGAQDVRVHIVQFGSTASPVGTYDIISGGTLNATALAEAIADVNAMTGGGNTNYEAGLQQALRHIQGGSQTIEVDELLSSPDANGASSDGVTRLVGNNGQHIALISGWETPGTTSGDLINANGSITAGWGASDGSNDQIDPGQLVRFDFGAFNNFSVGSFGNPGGFNGVPVLSATFTLQDNSSFLASTNFTYTIHFADGSPAESDTINVGNSTNVTLAGTGGNLGREVAYIQFTVGNGDEGDVDLQSITTMPAAPGTLAGADVNSLIFISDGEPNRALDDSGNVITVSTQNAIDQILGVDDPSNEVGDVEGNSGGLDQAFTIEVFNVGPTTKTLTIDGSDANNNDVNAAGGFNDNNATNDDDAVILTANGTAVALVSGWLSTSTAIGNLVDANGGTSGIGVQDSNSNLDGDDQLDTNQVLRFDFGAPADYDGAGNYSAANIGFNGPPVSSASFEFDSFGSGSHTIDYRVFYTNNTSDPGFTSVNFSGGDVTQVITAPPGLFIDYIEFVNTGSGDGQIDLQSVVTPSSALALLDQVEGSGGSAETITSPGDLANSLSALIASLAGTPGGEEDCGPIVVHDETAGVQNMADPNAQTDVTGATLLAGGAAIASLFAGVAFTGVDLHAASLDNGAIGFARSGAGISPVTLTANFGADGPAGVGSISHVLSIPGGEVANGSVYSGLDTTEGRRIYLFQEDGLIVGRVDADDDNEATSTDEAAFAIAIDALSGELYVAQYLSLENPIAGSGTVPPGSHDEQIRILEDAIQVTVTVTDHDNDTASSDPISIGGFIAFHDGGPTANDDDARDVAEDAVAISGNVLTNDVAGADGATLTHVQLPGGSFVEITSGLQEPAGVYSHVVAGLGTYTFSASGAWTFDPVINPSASAVNGTFDYRITDGDGDTSEGVQPITVLNSNEPPTVGALTMRVSEEGLTAANPDTSGNTDTTNSATDSAALPVADPDGDTLTVTFGDPGAVLTSNNQPVTWSGVGTGMLVGSVGSTTIITLAIVGTTINVELSGPVDHPDPTQEDEIGFAVPINVSDGQETTPGSVSVVIEDDAPDTFSPADSAIFNIASSVTAALDVADNVGADTPPTVSFDGIDNGDPATGSIGGNPLSTLTSNGLPIFLYNFGTVLIGTTQVMADPAGVDEIADLNSGSFVFSVTLDPDVGDNNYTFEMLGTIDNGSGVSFSNFAEIGSPGNNNFVAADQPSGTDLVIQATVTGSTANTATFGSSVDFGVNNQSINAAQGLILDFVTLLPVVNSAADYSGHNTVNGVSFTMAQIQGNNTTADVFVRAFNADDDGDFEPRLGDGGDTVVTITGISINGVMLTPVALAALDVLDPDGFGNGLVLENLSEIDVVVVFTSSGFDRLQISNAVDLGGANAYDGNPFSVTAFAVATVESGEPVTLNFDVRLTDSDGDSTVADFEVVVAPPATPPTVAVDIVDASLSDADPSSLVTFQFDQDVAGFDEADLTAVGGTLSNFTVVDDNTYEVTFTADGGFSGTGSVTVGTGYTDISGTVAGATGSDTVAIAANTTPVANDDIVISNFGGSTFTVPEWAFLANDTDADGDPLDIQGVNDEFGLATLSHSAGSGTNGTITINDNSFAGGTFDYVGTDGTATSEGDVTYVQDSNSITGTSADEIIVGDDDSDTFNGNGGNDVILVGGGNDTIVGDQSDYVLDGGGDTDTLQVGANFTSTGNGQIVSIEKIVLTAANTTLNLSNQTEALRIVGSSGVDTITGGSGADIITGGAGNDIVTGGLGTDQFRLQTNGGVDAISDFTVGTDRIGLFDDGSTGSGSVNFAGTGGSAAGTALAAGDFQIRNAITAIQGGDDNHVVLINTAQTTAQIAGANGANNSQNIYVVVFNSTTGRGEIWFDSDWDNDPAGRVQVATLSSITSLAQLTALTAADFVVYNSATDPLVLDLGAPGLDFAGLENGVSFDINADGALDQIAWTTGEDGILGLDVDGNGTIDNGGEIFSPYFAGGDYASSLAALASLDANGDGVMDANDAAFASLTVWQDANHDGISEASELSSLADRGITSIDLSATPADSTIDGQQVVSEGTFTTAGGGSGTFVEVAFDTSLAPGANDGPQTFALDNANAAEIISGYSAARGDIIDVSGLLEANFASDSNLSDFVNVLQDGSDVTIQIDQNGPASGAHFVDVAVLQGYGSSASDIVRIAFESAEYQVAV
jgi:T1SS-143 domain-containing protein